MKQKKILLGLLKKQNSKKTFNIEKYPQFFYFHPSIWSAIYKKDLIEDNNIRLEPIPGAGWTDNLFQVQTMCMAQKISYLDKGFYYYRQKNWDDAQDLKDYTIPFLRTKSVHEWLKKNQITAPEIWANLYKRELAYLHIIFRTTNFKKLKDISPLILDWQKQLKAEYILPDVLNFYEQRILRKMNSLNKIFLVFFSYRYCNLKKLRRFLFSVHISNKGFCLQILGVKISTPKYFDRPAIISTVITKGK